MSFTECVYLSISERQFNDYLFCLYSNMTSSQASAILSTTERFIQTCNLTVELTNEPIKNDGLAYSCLRDYSPGRFGPIPLSARWFRPGSFQPYFKGGSFGPEYLVPEADKCPLSIRGREKMANIFFMIHFHE